MPDVHLKLSPSASGRWLACPGSLQLGEGENSSSEYAREGSAAHKLAEVCLTLGVDPYAPELGTEIDGFPITSEMQDAIQIYLDVMQTEADEEPEVSVQWERFIQDAEWPEFGGTVDGIIFTPDTLTVVDFKYGAGVAVDAVDNTQMLCYALLALRETGRSSLKFRLIVVQPRAHHPDGPIRIWGPTHEEVLEFEDRVERVIQEKSTRLEAGDHCKWCPHKLNCPELQALVVDTAKREFSEEESSGRMTPASAALLLSKEKAIVGYIKAVREWSHGQMEKGAEIPGFKLVNRFGNRKYRFPEEDLFRMLKNRKVPKKVSTETKILSPAALEKVVDKTLVNTLCERALLGTTVVPESDRREAVTFQNAKEEFQNE